MRHSGGLNKLTYNMPFRYIELLSPTKLIMPSTIWNANQRRSDHATSSEAAHLLPLLLTWIDFNPSMDKESQAQ